MNDEQIECLIERIIQRLTQPVLVMISGTAGYRQAIRNRLARCGYRLHLLLDKSISDADQWQSIGDTLSANSWQETLHNTPYRALLLPFLDYPLAADLVNGSLQNPLARHVHEALLKGVPVMALRYHCDPTSELNQLLGVQPDAAYQRHMQVTLARLTECGITLCTMNELLEKLAMGGESAALTKTNKRRYLTVTDLKNNPALASSPEVRLTDAAMEFVNNRK
ncbi:MULTISPECIES: hypothetical protein [Pantoea]|uniref:Flavoprotein n=1 Tax=Candidatus Pantoea gossypiicola TaxID=2608008 RepID=A0AB34CJ18_9GAMM|nr:MULTISPECIES: hypothetical protein [Pantoea]KAA5931031.1 hypothetical protein F3I59_07695 [Pantoea sp. VH_8]KAA5935698.1 hypothetical protein F3I58_08890 [Pantoea sp. VH_4]KAA5987392.1 hypothetical protein F3I49_06740 [Pantoea sp. M_4]KAA6125071.1 hypothetical protein F3I20_11560 [Pantoea gossypiicola]